MLHAVEAIEYLIEKEVDVRVPDVNGIQPITVACERGALDIVIALLKAGASVRTVDKNLVPILQVAVQKGKYDIVNFLLNLHRDEFASYELAGVVDPADANTQDW